jgi:hypothetical protein
VVSKWNCAYTNSFKIEPKQDFSCLIPETVFHIGDILDVEVIRFAGAGKLTDTEPVPSWMYMGLVFNVCQSFVFCAGILVMEVAAVF